MNITNKESCHIAAFTIERCEKAIELCKDEENKFKSGHQTDEQIAPQYNIT